MGFISGKTRFFNRRLAIAVSLIALSSFNYGFDNQAFATTQAMDAFDKRFGEYDPIKKTYYLPSTWLALFNSLNYIGFAAGVIIGSFVSARWGRRMCMFVMSIYAIGTATIAVTSTNKHHVMAARVLNYIYVGMELAVVPAYQSEIVPAPLALILGGLVINCVCLGTSTLSGDESWRIPLGLFHVIPVIISTCIWFLPESPRWLLSKGRVDEARASLTQYRSGSFTEEEIDKEFRETQVQLELASERGRFLDIFASKNLKRTFLVVGINFFQQATGQQFASQYGGIYVKQLGTINPFVFTLLVAVVNATAIAISLLTNDNKIGRRKPLLLSATIMCTALMIMGALGTQDVISKSTKIAIVSMLCFMTFGFSLGLAPLTYVVATEIPALGLRDATLRLGFCVNVLFNFVSNFILPYLLAALGSKTGFVFGSVAFLGVLFIYFCIPECKGKTLEQVDRMFQEGVPLRKFGDFAAEDLGSTAQKDEDDAVVAQIEVGREKQ
uniref:Major facilitator superfamily (MFS) profile domain-containing protein n=1 Tax=Bionectria ochroleuca TaxID=29856 RepID=A0A8H7K9P3_BIOOC